VATESKRVAVPAGIKRAYGELDRAQVVAAVHNLARRVGVQRVTMRELATELGVAVPSVYYHVPGKQAALDLLADSLLAAIPVPAAGRWDIRLIELYCAAREVLLRVHGVASMLQTRTPGESARRLDRLSRSLLAEAGLAKAPAAAAHTVLYTYVLGSVSLEESRSPASPAPGGRGNHQATASFRAGLDVIVAGIQASAVW
jgi:TetR/AcrR family tetracycline transcriptional repressor